MKNQSEHHPVAPMARYVALNRTHAILIVLCFLWVACVASNPVEAYGPVVGDPAPDFVAENLQPSTPDSFQLSAHLGQIVVIEFFAFWSGPERNSASVFRQTIADVYADSGVVVVGVEQNANISGIEDGPENVLAFIGQFSWTFPVVRDVFSRNTIFDSFGTERNNWIVVDQLGRIAYKSSDHYTGLDFNTTYRQSLINTISSLLATGEGVAHLGAPNGGESWVAGDVDTVRWSIAPGIVPTSVRLEYSIGIPPIWQDIFTGSAAGGRFAWTIPPVSSDQAMVRVTVTDNLNRQFADSSDVAFHLVASLAPSPLLYSRWGSAGTSVGQFQLPTAVAVDLFENIYVADTGNHRVQIVSFSGSPRMTFGSQGSTPGKFESPEGIGIGPDGSIFVGDTGNNRVQKFSASGALQDLWGQPGSGPGQFNQPAGISLDEAGYVYVADRGNHRIQKFDAYGQFIASWGSAAPGTSQLLAPTSICTFGENLVYVTDLVGGRVRVFSSAGVPITNWPVDLPTGVCADQSGNIFVIDGKSRRVLRLLPNGILDQRWGEAGVGLGQFLEPRGIGVHGDGEAYSVHVLDRTQSTVQRFIHSSVSGVADNRPSDGITIGLVPVENPFQGVVTLRVLPFPNSPDLAPGAVLAMMVTDVSGKIMSRVIIRQPELSLQGSISWDGTGLSGRPAAPGVYFVSLDVDGRRFGSAKVVLAK